MSIAGDSITELFRAGVVGMGNILREGICNENNRFHYSTKIRVSAQDPTCLLVDFLSDILSASYDQNVVFCKVHFLDFTLHSLVAEIRGEQIKEFDEEIKAVTYHEADVRKTNTGQWETLIIFDI